MKKLTLKEVIEVLACTEYKLTNIKKQERLFGLYVPSECPKESPNRIFVDVNKTYQFKLNTIIHELIHARNDLYEMSDIEEEVEARANKQYSELFKKGYQRWWK